MLTLSLISPVPKIFNFVEFLLINLSFFKVSVLMSSEPLSVLLSMYDWIFSRFKIATFSVDIELNPLLGRRLYKGIWPPSKLFIATPDLDFCPLTPLPQVFPLLDPIPLPTLILGLLIFSLLFNCVVISLFFQLFLIFFYF